MLDLGIGIPDPLPQPLQHVRAGGRREPLIRAQPLDNGLNDLFLDPVRAGIPLSVVEHSGKPTDNRIVTVSVLVLETEKFP